MLKVLGVVLSFIGFGQLDKVTGGKSTELIKRGTSATFEKAQQVIKNDAHPGTENADNATPSPEEESNIGDTLKKWGLTGGAGVGGFLLTKLLSTNNSTLLNLFMGVVAAGLVYVVLNMDVKKEQVAAAKNGADTEPSFSTKNDPPKKNYDEEPVAEPA